MHLRRVHVWPTNLVNFRNNSLKKSPQILVAQIVSCRLRHTLRWTPHQSEVDVVCTVTTWYINRQNCLGDKTTRGHLPQRKNWWNARVAEGNTSFAWSPVETHPTSTSELTAIIVVIIVIIVWRLLWGFLKYTSEVTVFLRFLHLILLMTLKFFWITCNGIYDTCNDFFFVLKEKYSLGYDWYKT